MPPARPSFIPGGIRLTFGPGVADLNQANDEALLDIRPARAKADPATTVSVNAWAPGTNDDPSTPRRLALDRALAARGRADQCRVGVGPRAGRVARLRQYRRRPAGPRGHHHRQAEKHAGRRPRTRRPRTRRPRTCRQRQFQSRRGQSRHQARRQPVAAMTRPHTYLIRMLLFLAAVCVLGAVLFDKLAIAFANNPPLNGLIGFVLLAGIVWNLHQVLRLSPEVRWIEIFRMAPERAATAVQPRLLAPMASMLVARADHGAERTRLTLSAAITRGMLDSLSSRLDESRELSRYTTGLLIFLGLLGTFWACCSPWARSAT